MCGFGFEHCTEIHFKITNRAQTSIGIIASMASKREDGGNIIKS